jgi:hypothetical protein
MQQHPNVRFWHSKRMSTFLLTPPSIFSSDPLRSVVPMLDEATIATRRCRRGNRMKRLDAHSGGAAVWPLASILSFAVVMLVVGLRSASAQECDYKTCGELMARDGSMSWSISGGRDYSPDTKRACAELNACVRRAKNNMAKRAPAAPAAKSGSLESSRTDSGTELRLEPANKQARGVQPASPKASNELTTSSVPTANGANGKPTRCFAVAEILVPIDCSPDRPPSGR